MAFPAWLQEVSLSNLRQLNLRIQSQLDDSLFTVHDNHRYKTKGFKV